ncbi:MAG: ion transporter [Rhodospirillales bacterium]|nr:ion transporter [Rhodospirillales bacterium]
MKIRERICNLVEGDIFQRFITALIVLNAITLGLETVPDVTNPYGALLHKFDVFVLTMFTIEILAKLQYRGIGFFKNGWNVFDFVIVSIALLPSTSGLSVLRALRILRTLRLISVVPQMRRVVQALITAIPGMLSVGAIILLVFYIGAVLTTNLYGTSHPQWFGTIGESMYSLFQIMTLESWSMGIVRPVMEVHPSAWGFFVPFILITSFAILNLFIGIIVDAMQTQHMEEEEVIHREVDSVHEDTEAIRQELTAVRQELAIVRRLLEEKSK